MSVYTRKRYPAPPLEESRRKTAKRYGLSATRIHQISKDDGWPPSKAEETRGRKPLNLPQPPPYQSRIETAKIHGFSKEKIYKIAARLGWPRPRPKGQPPSTTGSKCECGGKTFLPSTQPTPERPRTMRCDDCGKMMSFEEVFLPCDKCAARKKCKGKAPRVMIKDGVDVHQCTAGHQFEADQGKVEPQ